MAEYYPLLARAVAGLPEPTREARQALYDRARGALLNQLRNLQPPVAETDIMRETEALATAAARLESEFDAKSAAGAESARPPSRPDAVADATPKSPATGRSPSTPPFFTSPRTRPVPPLPRQPGAAEPQAPRNSARVEPPAPELAGVAAPTRAAVPNAQSASQSALQPAAQRMPQLNPQLNEAAETNGSAPSLKLRPEMSRPYAPQPREAEAQPNMRRLWIVGAILALFVALIAVAAWKLRDRPEDLVRQKPAQQSQVEPSGGKISERVGSAAKATDSSRTTAAVSTQDAARARSEEPAPLPVAQRAALLVEAPEEQSKVKTYVGSVVWRLDNVSNGSGQPLGTAVRADIDIPEAKFKAAMIFQKNFDASLSASHTVTLVFTPAPDSPIGNVKEIRVPQMRALESQAGDALVGIPVPIMENSFLVGLSRGNAEAMNLDLIKQREWVDIPMILQTNNRVAKLTFEKSATGARAIEDAVAVWKAPQ